MNKIITFLIITFSYNLVAFANGASSGLEKELFYKKHVPEISNGKVVVLTHGIMEHSGRYMEFIGKLNSEGYIVYRYDLRGHGLSSGERSHIDDFDQYITDLGLIVSVVEMEEKGRPIFLFGHSMGGLITYTYINNSPLPESIKGVVLSSPGLNLPLTWIDKVELFFARPGRHIFPHKKAGKPIDSSLLTEDLFIIERDINDDLIESDFTISLAVELTDASYAAQDMISKSPDLPPILFIQGTHDEVVDAEENIRSARLMTSEANIVIVQDGLHEPLNASQSDREHVTNRIIQFFDSINP